MSAREYVFYCTSAIPYHGSRSPTVTLSEAKGLRCPVSQTLARPNHPLYTTPMLLASLDTNLNTFHLELSFSADAGKTTVLLGESGAGKSTVLRLLAGLDERRPAQLSGGQQQRVAIARALVLQPQLLLLDEPLAALDVQTRREVRQELRHILAQVGITTVLVTHQYLEALLFGYHILVLDHGQLVQQGSQGDLLQHPRSSYVAELVGTNFFRGRVVRCETNTICTIQLYGNGGQPVKISASLEEHTPADQLPAAGEEAFVVVDPRSITLYQTAPDASARNIFHGEIVQLLRLGTPAAAAGNGDDGRVRVSILLDTPANSTLSPTLLTAEITGASAGRMQLSEGKSVYATFKATEARAYT